MVLFVFVHYSESPLVRCVARYGGPLDILYSVLQPPFIQLHHYIYCPLNSLAIFIFWLLLHQFFSFCILKITLSIEEAITFSLYFELQIQF